MVSGDHHDLAGRQGQEGGGTQVDFGVRFVMTEEFGRENTVPGKMGVLGHLSEERKIAIGQRSDEEFLFETEEGGDSAGPRAEAMPDAIEMVDLSGRPVGYAITRKQIEENLTVEVIEWSPGEFAAADAIHGGSISGAPVKSKAGPIDRETEAAIESLAFASDRAVPVDNCAEDIE